MTQDNSSSPGSGSPTEPTPEDERQNESSALLSRIRNFYEAYKNAPPELQKELAALYATAKPEQQAGIRQNLQECAEADPQNALSVINSLRDNVLAVSAPKPAAGAGPASGGGSPARGDASAAVPGAGAPNVGAGVQAPNMTSGTGTTINAAPGDAETTNMAPERNDGGSGGAWLQPAERPPTPSGDLSLRDELGIGELNNPVFGGRGRIFSTAGRNSPVASFTDNFLVLYPPQKPFSESGPSEDIAIRVDKRGVLIDELERPKHISGAKFRGQQLWYLGEQKRGTLKHFAVWFDQGNVAHKLFVNDDALTTDIVYRLRNKTHDGEISIFPDIKSD